MNAHQKRGYKLFVRNHLTFSALTHFGKELSGNYREKKLKFIKLNKTYREQNDLEFLK